MRIVDPPPKSQWSELLPQTNDEVPPGFQSVREISVETGHGYSTVGHWMLDLLARGKVEKRMIRANNHRPIPYYRPSDYEQKQKQASIGQKHRCHR
jgi:hypothetical protein